MERVLRSAVLLVAVGCGSADRGLDLGALTARDLLGVEPGIAMGWDDVERERVAETIAAAAEAGGSENAPLGYASDPAAAILASVTAIDYRRARAGDDAIVFGRASVTRATHARVVVDARLPGERPGPAVEIVPSGWSDRLAALLQRDPDRLSAIAAAAGHPDGETLYVSPAAQEPFATLYLPERRQLLINPVYLVTLDPVEEPRATALASRGTRIAAPRPVAATAGGNPYSFFGSIAECAADHRLRCEGCAGTGTCEAVTRDIADGDAECEAFAADNERGFYLFCANLSAAIATVADCIAETAPACPINRGAGNQLGLLDANAALLDDPLCLEATDSCLASIFGDPDGDFGDVPGTGDPPPPPPPPPREVDFGCSDNEIDCDFAPQVGCSSEGCASGPSCGSCNGGCEGGGCDSSCDGGDGCDSSCDSGSCEGGGCDSSNNCEAGSCDSCSSESGGGCDSGCSGSSCDSGGDSGGSSCDSGGDSGGGSCSGGDSGGGCGGGSSGGGSCGGSGGGSSCGGSGGGSSCGGGGGGSQCNVSRKRVAGTWGPPVLWGLFPLLVLGQMRRRERRRRR